MTIMTIRNWAILTSIFFSEVAMAQITRVPESDGGPFRVIFGLLLVLGLIAGLAWAMKKLNHAKIGNQSVAKIVGGVSVGPRERVVVVEIGGNWVVVGVASGQVNSLANFKVSELDFSDGYDEAPFYEDETAPSTKRSGREQYQPEPRFEFRPEFDEGQPFTSSADREDSRKTQSSFIPQTNSAKFHKENVKRFLRKILKVGDGNE
ncbi:flagellar biosynthetic protein FliO [Polynucleobacter sp. AP-Kaivos-20-H2]|uniref:flagellar biosynthetic protein FliO n=1 Tax=Polynucleobacter sp. AP-Kaivos-20-H2 TaxID=2689104 RepID=UPI001C0E8407|nr:flagellar biosynthetic protein FliO [Polynucleobacter sp. AP-Kaivos-20-H2]MBU3603397.1 flagellar biosynthetic protein FliO [Polynucleobacter sp. AP-Kaivos-20-H2]